MNEVIERTMISALPEIKERYQKFVLNNKIYHGERSSLIEPEEMYSQCVNRTNIIAYLSDLCDVFENDSYHILSAFDEYQKDERIRNSFKSFINLMIKLIKEREELNKWLYELNSEEEALEEAEVTNLTSQDLDIH